MLEWVSCKRLRGKELCFLKTLGSGLTQSVSGHHTWCFPPSEGDDTDFAPSVGPARLGLQGLGLLVLVGGDFQGLPINSGHQTPAICLFCPALGYSGNQGAIRNCWPIYFLGIGYDSRVRLPRLKSLCHHGWAVWPWHISPYLWRRWTNGLWQLESLLCQSLDPALLWVLAAPSSLKVQGKEREAV